MFERKKTIIGMVHLPPLPGTPLYDDSLGIDYIYSRIEADVINLQEGGIDSIMFCNENDRPYKLDANYATVATMGYVIGKVSHLVKVPFGIDVLWDPFAAISLAKATKASFIREILTGVYVSDMGFWNTNVGEVYRYKKLLDAKDVKVFFNISAEFAYSLDRRPLDEIAKSVAFSSLADVILVSGPMTGKPPTKETLEKVKESVNIPVFVNTGVNENNVEELLSVADGAIVGTALKKDGFTFNPIDVDRVKRLMEKVNKLR
ncbi:BtpA/SgcQ family protein [Caldisericum exile]|uniref:SgcQ protein n=1 Tax=Caldisericum exile TaxID=693075 RepID=A0A2J6X9I2_9BACT|nr:MAG: SgcQ protein [Caldisericum exile]